MASIVRAAASVMLLGGIAATAGRPASEADPRLLSLQKDIARLERERDELKTRERGLLGDLLRLDAEMRLNSAQLEEVGLRLGAARATLLEHETRLRTIEAEQRRRVPYVAARVREIYKEGTLSGIRQLLAPAEAVSSRDGLRYALYLSRRDAVQWSAWREASRRLAEERAALVRETARLASLQGEVGRSAAGLAASRKARADLLARIRDDREQHDNALAELESAARALGKIVDTLGSTPVRPTLDVRMFRGLLDWPAEGTVTSGFGNAVHPKFRTVVPHPGLDIDAPDGAAFRSVFDGRVAFAAALHGYGLTAIVDHGGGVLSVYAHAGVLLVSQGDDVVRGQELGRVGDSGSLRGPYLYFELRDGGRPVDPAAWLRRR
jgi:septal ring factor EnvC (AmiA/AmiB activator)